MQTFHPRPDLDEIIKLVKDNQKIKIRLSVNKDVPLALTGQGLRFKFVVYRLLMNAIKRSGNRRPQITIKAYVADWETFASMHLESESDDYYSAKEYLVLEVIDLAKQLTQDEIT